MTVTSAMKCGSFETIPASPPQKWKRLPLELCENLRKLRNDQRSEGGRRWS
jgi:hypothetical protein